MLRIIIAGSRYFNDYITLENVVIEKLFMLNKRYPQYNVLTINKEEKQFKINRENFEIISGMAKGADSLAVKFANKYGLSLKEFPAKWDDLSKKPCKIMENSHGKYNALAGHNRNMAMAKYASSGENSGVLILFWDGQSKGSQNMKNQAIVFGLEIFEYDITGGNKVGD